MIRPLPGTGAGGRRIRTHGPGKPRAASQLDNAFAGFADEVSAHPTMRPQAPPAAGRRAAAVRNGRDGPDAAAPVSGKGRYRHPHLFSKAVLSWVELNRGRVVLRPHQQLRTCCWVRGLIEKHPLLKLFS